ncbi:MAG: LexA family protein [Armatimonadota bacterium]
MVVITERELEILQAIAELTAARWYAPTHREVAKRSGYGLATVCELVTGLRGKGVLAPSSRRARELRIVRVV